jgi:hypothetical protein
MLASDEEDIDPYNDVPKINSGEVKSSKPIHTNIITPKNNLKRDVQATI